MKPSEIDKLIWEKIKEKSIHEFNPPSNLFHYTTANGIKAVVEKGGMFASPFFSMNDPKELVLGFEIVKEICGQLARAGDDTGVALAILENPILEQRIKSVEHTFWNLICFSEEEDNLSEWRSYSENGNGFAVEIDTRILRPQPQGWYFFRCIYDRQVQIDKAKALLDGIIITFREMGSEVELNEFINIAVPHVFGLVSVFKHPAYKDEKEWRLLLQEMDKSKFESFVSGSSLKVSTLMEIKMANAIKRIWIGPKNNFRTANLALQTLMLKSPLKGTIEIKNSEAPYR